MFCAKTSTREPRVESTIACSAVNGDADRDVDAVDGDDAAAAAPAMYSSASATVLCIFQLPAMNGVRVGLTTGPPRRAASCPR